VARTYTGGCHCGAVRFEVDLDLGEGTIRCNCSICTKARAWLAGVDGSKFRLLRGEDDLSEYQFGSKRIRHRFCRHCGIKSFGMGTDDDGRQFVAVLVNCLEDVTDAELAAAPITHVNGRNDDFVSAPAVTAHL
jgi:hypothetical protein